MQVRAREDLMTKMYYAMSFDVKHFTPKHAFLRYFITRTVL